MTPKTLEEKLIALRAAFAAALKYYWEDSTAFDGKWQKVLRGGKLNIVTMYSVKGDIFAFWYNELRLPADELVYLAVASDFFEVI